MAENKEASIPTFECLADQAISEDSLDAFGHRHYVRALAAILENPKHDPPFSVGLLGAWGTGKSTIRELYLRKLEDAAGSAHERMMTVEFSAWRHGGENMKRALLRDLFLALGGDEAALDDKLYSTIRTTVDQQRETTQILKDMGLRILWPLLQLLLVSLLCLGLLFVAHKLGMSAEGLSIFGTSGVLTLGWLTKIVFDPKRLIAPHFSAVTRVDAPYATAEQYEKLLLKQLTDVKNGTALASSGKRLERLVVFVDDLDRLSARETIEGLEAIRTFMDLPRGRLPEGFGVVFVVSCDETKIAESLASSGDGAARVGGLDRNDARRYLDRVFQYRLEIPPLAKQDMRTYARRRLRAEMPQLAAELERSSSADLVIDRLIHVGVSNPRSAIQHVNAFAQAWWIARTREAEGIGNDRTGLLGDGVITKHPLTLAALSALRVSFPDFYSDLEKEPELLTAFLNVLLRQAPIAEQPERIRNRLQKYSTDEGIKPQYRPLRRYIFSLQALTLPRALKPFLLLSQDSVSRKHGDAAVTIHESLVSGDHQGVLEALGRELDDRPLGEESIKLLVGLVDDLHGDSPARLDNAHFVVAALAHRAPPGSAKRLAVPVARRFISSSAFRHRISLTQLRSTMNHLSRDDRRAVAAQLVGDYFAQDELEARLPSGELPSLDEAKKMAQEACDLVLATWRDDGLSAQAQKAFLNWLTERDVALSGDRYVFGYEQFEDWVGQNEAIILRDWQRGYCDSVVRAFSGADEARLEPTRAVGRLKTVVRSMRAKGEASRGDLWAILAALVATRNEALVLFAGEHGRGFELEPPPSAFSTYVAAVIQRLHDDMTEDGWELESWSDLADVLAEALKKRGGDLSATAAGLLPRLIQEWEKQDTTLEYASHLLQWLLHHHVELAKPVIDSWISRSATDLPLELVRTVGREYGSLSRPQQNQLFAGVFQPHLQTNNFPDPAAERFKAFARAIPRNALTSQAGGQITAYLQKRLPSQIPNPGYLEKIMPAVAHMIGEAGIAELTPNVTSALTAAKDKHPVSFAFIHESMAGAWQVTNGASDQLGTMISEACTFITSRPQTAEAHRVLSALASLSARTVEPRLGSANLLDAAIRVYPYARNVAEPLLLQGSTAPLSSKQLAGLSVGPNTSTDEAAESIGRIWSAQVPRLSEADVEKVGKQILGEPPITALGAPDVFLQALFAACPAPAPLATQLLEDNDLNDAQHRRVVVQVARTPDRFVPSDICRVVELVCGRPAQETTLVALMDAAESLSVRFEDQEERNALARLLAIAIPKLDSSETRSAAAKWIQRLDALGVVRQRVVVSQLTEDERDVLEKYFPSKKSWLGKLRG